MKKTAVCLALISLLVLSIATLLQAAEQKIVFNSESIEYKSGTGSTRCQDKCNRRSGPDIKSLLSAGWKIVRSSSKKVVGEDYWYVPCNACEPHGCTCLGTEYLLQKDEPLPKVETSINKHDDRDINQRTGVYDSKSESSINELDRLKNENVILKHENTLLKQEIEKFKNLIKSKKK